MLTGQLRHFVKSDKKHKEHIHRFYDLGVFLIGAILLVLVFGPLNRPLTLEYIRRISLSPIFVDLNRNGREDVVAINRKMDRLLVFLNSGDERYQKCYISEVKASTTKASLSISSTLQTSLGLEMVIPLRSVGLRVRVEDKNADGYPDICLEDMRGITWFINNGGGQFKEKIREWKSYGAVEFRFNQPK